MALLSSGNKNNPSGEMSFLEHLEALRWHIVRSAAVILTTAIVLFLYKEFLFDDILLAPKNPGFLTYRVMCRAAEYFSLPDLCISRIDFNLISTDLSAQFTIHMWAAIVGGLVVGFPYLIYELWRFVKPALKDKEKRYARGIVFYTSILFLMGVLFGYYVITPMSVNFLGTYQVSETVRNTITLSSFIGTVTTLTLITGLLFEMPIVIYFLTKIGIMSPTFMRKYRRHSVVFILILAAIITPTSDATTMLLVAVPLWILYELSIFVSAYVTYQRNAAPEN